MENLLEFLRRANWRARAGAHPSDWRLEGVKPYPFSAVEFHGSPRACLAASAAPELIRGSQAVLAHAEQNENLQPGWVAVRAEDLDQLRAGIRKAEGWHTERIEGLDVELHIGVYYLAVPGPDPGTVEIRDKTIGNEHLYDGWQPSFPQPKWETLTLAVSDVGAFCRAFNTPYDGRQDPRRW